MSSELPTQGTPKRTPKAALLILLVVLVAGVIGLSYYLYQKGEKISNSNTGVQSNSSVNGAQNVNGTSNSNIAVGQNTNASAATNTTKNQNVGTGANANTSVDTSAWKSYENPTWGFSFRYPADWAILHDRLPNVVKVGNSPNEDLLIGVAASENKTSLPSIDIIINPSGFGPIFPDVKYRLAKSIEGFVITSTEEIATAENLEPGFFQINAFTDSGPEYFDMFFSTTESNSDQWPATVRSILSTFRFSD